MAALIGSTVLFGRSRYSGAEQARIVVTRGEDLNLAFDVRPVDGVHVLSTAYTAISLAISSTPAGIPILNFGTNTGHASIEPMTSRGNVSVPAAALDILSEGDTYFFDLWVRGSSIASRQSSGTILIARSIEPEWDGDGETPAPTTPSGYAQEDW